MTGVVIFAGTFCCVVALSLFAAWRISRELRLDRIQRERDAANARTWAHIVESRAADWKAWEVQMKEAAR